jgi:hypothetical protein
MWGERRNACCQRHHAVEPRPYKGLLRSPLSCYYTIMDTKLLDPAILDKYPASWNPVWGVGLNVLVVAPPAAAMQIYFPRPPLGKCWWEIGPSQTGEIMQQFGLWACGHLFSFEHMAKETTLALKEHDWYHRQYHGFSGCEGVYSSEELPSGDAVGLTFDCGLYGIYADTYGPTKKAIHHAAHLAKFQKFQTEADPSPQKAVYPFTVTISDASSEIFKIEEVVDNFNNFAPVNEMGMLSVAPVQTPAELQNKDRMFAGNGCDAF